MKNELYPDDYPVTEKDFRDSGWKDALRKAKREGYASMSQALYDAADQARTKGNQSHGKVLWLLANACSMMLVPKSPNEPFRPLWVMFGKRSPIPDDLSESDIAFYAKAASATDDPWLKARLSDIVWLKQREGGYQFALAAIDAYCSIPLDNETWVRDGRECWKRAIQLTLRLGKGAKGRMTQIEIAILNAFKVATKQDGFFALGLSSLIITHKLERTKREEIARKLELLAGQFDADGNLASSRDYFHAAAMWFRLASNEKKAALMMIGKAESWVKEAEANSSHMVANDCYNKAIQTYRDISREEREAHGADARLKDLTTRLTDAGKKSLDEMMHVSSPPMDISEIVNNARKAVSGKTPIEALKFFCNLSPGFDAKQSCEEVLKQLRDRPLQAFFSTTYKSRDGRTIAKRPGMDFDDVSSENSESTIRATMAQNYGFEIGLRVQGVIWPAHDVLLLEHRLREHDFVDLAAQSPIVPEDRAILFGKALFSGYDRDFVTALHLLVPQIENMVRYHLNRAGIKTAALDGDGIEPEKGLSSLMGAPEVEKIFGPNICCEIRMLFCDPFGSNLRNELAHGLLDIDQCQSPAAIYAWWFALRMVFNTYWNAVQKAAQNDNNEAQKK